MFYVIEQGARIQTPLDSLLKNTAVNQVSATSAVRASVRQELNAAAQKTADKTDEHSAERKVYQQIERGQQRKAVVYAHQIMTSPVISASVSQPLSAIWQLLSKRGFHHLPLVDEQQHIQGIVSDRDILRFAANNNPRQGSVIISQLMTRSVITAGRQTEVRTLAEVMSRRAIGALPIEDDELNLVGIVTRSDILRTLVNHGPLELWA